MATPIPRATVSQVSACLAHRQRRTGRRGQRTPHSSGWILPGNLQKLTWSDFHLGDTASLFTETESGAIVATSVFRGVLFMVQGQVTALQRDGQGKLQSVVIDGAYAIHISQSSFDYMGAGNMGNGMGGNMSGGMMGGGMMGGGGMGGGGGMMGGGGGMMGNGDSSFVQVGSTIAAGGMVENGLFSAAFVAHHGLPT